MARKEKENLGYVYYVEQGLNAKETALKCGVTEKTVGEWVKKQNWKEIRAARNATPKMLLHSYNEILTNLVERKLEISRKEKQDVTELKSLSDEIAKIGKQIENIKKDEKSISISHKINIISRFTDKFLPIANTLNCKSEFLEFAKQYAIDLYNDEQKR
jgi:transposase